jgi:putative DNA methylase
MQRRKLIEVALPLEAINRESAREKQIRHGHPSTIHMWWARRPLAACRAVLFASIVDDPSSRIEEFPSEDAQWTERERLFGLIEEFVKWENSNNDRVLERVREEIRKATSGAPPAVLDPFCGAGSIPLEALRLGLEAHASDLNPVAVLITKALVEIPATFYGRAPINPESRRKMAHSGSWHGAQSLAEDVRYYGTWMRDEAERRVGHLYPKVALPHPHGGGTATVIAWLWGRTVACPNPACGAQMPLVRSLWLSTKSSNKAWLDPIVDLANKSVRLDVKTGVGAPPESPKTGRGAKFRCLVCEQIAADQHIKDEGAAKRMGAQLMAIVTEGQRGRAYLPPDAEQIAAAASAAPEWRPEQSLANDPRAIWCVNYGLDRFGDLFTPRQLVALTTFSDLVGEAREQAKRDAVSSGLPDDGIGLGHGGAGALAYADAIATFLGLAVDKAADRNSSLCTWESRMDRIRNTFTRQGLPMVWDFAETNPFAGAGGDIRGTVESLCEVLDSLPRGPRGVVKQLDATTAVDGVAQPLICTDPPYYDNIGYADLSDFFYIWLRRSLRGIYPDLFSTVLTPKAQELVAIPYRFEGSKARAEHFFEEGLGRAFERMHDSHNRNFPLCVFYAFKQAESDEGPGDGSSSLASTGWETMLEALLRTNFVVTGTWPMRTELLLGLKQSFNALASSIVLVCRPRAADAGLATRREFAAALRAELPVALRYLQQGNIAPVDLAQASIGPGMAVFSRYAKVLEADGSPMRVRTALGLINQVLDEVMAEQESEYDAATRWAISWFEQHGLDEGRFGDAETLSKAKNVAVAGLVQEGLLSSRGGKVRLLSRPELDSDWDPTTDRQLAVWEVTQQLVRVLEASGEAGAAALLRKLGALGETARDLAYRLYTTCERKKWTLEALAYNSLVVAWPEISRLAAEPLQETQPTLGV